MAVTTEKLTISVPYSVLKITDEIAKARKMSRSKLVYLCLKEMTDKHFEEQMAEGYKNLAKDNLKFAKQTAHLAKEIVPEWK